jgi:hypothetical protein
MMGDCLGGSYRRIRDKSLVNEVIDPFPSL